MAKESQNRNVSEKLGNVKAVYVKQTGNLLKFQLYFICIHRLDVLFVSDYVFVQQFLLVEAESADLTREALLFPTVSAPVFLHVPRQPEAFVTYVACVRLLPGVEAHVDLQVARLDEGLAAHLALVRAHAGVVPAVAQELVAGQEGFAALRAGEGPLAGVSELVPFQRHLLHELPPAGGACEPDAEVDLLHVVLELRLRAVGHVALSAHPGSLLRVGSHVHGEVRGGPVRLPALPAQERLLPGVFPAMNRQQG